MSRAAEKAAMNAGLRPKRSAAQLKASMPAAPPNIWQRNTRSVVRATREATSYAAGVRW